MTDQPTTTPASHDEWMATQSAVVNWGPWPITSLDYELYGSEHAAAIAWCATRGIDPVDLPASTTVEYGHDEAGRRTVTVQRFAFDGRGRKILDEANSTFVKVPFTVLDEPTDGAA